jgi:hypothetical protein
MEQELRSKKRTAQNFSIETELWISNQVANFPQLSEIQGQRIAKIIQLGQTK